MKKSQNVNVNIDKYTVAMLLHPYMYNHVSVVECLLLEVNLYFISLRRMAASYLITTAVPSA